MSWTPRIKERPVKYKMLSTTIMESWETFTNRAMKQPNIQMRLLMKAIVLDVESKGWGNNANRVTFVDLQWKVYEKKKMNLSSWKHYNLYKSKEIYMSMKKYRKG